MKLLKFKDRPAHTLLVVMADKSYRLDADKHGTALTELQEIDAGCALPAKLPGCIKGLADATGALGRKTWVLFAFLPMQLLTLPAMQVAGVKDDVLLQALQFELEGVTGQATAGQALAYRLFNAQDELNQYWLTYIDALTLEDVNAVLRKAGSTLGALLHPGGLSAYIGNPAQSAWLRIEAWPEQVLALSSVNGDSDMRSFAFDTRHWQAALESWWSRAPGNTATETLLYNRIEVLPETQRVFHLHTVDDAALWLSLWAQTLIAQKTPPMPLLKPPPLFNYELAASIASGAAVLLLCLAHLLWNLKQTNYYEAETAQLKQTEQSMQALRKQITALQDEQTKLDAKLAKLRSDIEAIPKTLAALRQRPVKLLEALAQGRPQDLVVEEIASNQDAVTVKGVTLQAGLANQLSAHLETQLSGLNWQVAAPAKEDMHLFEGGGPWSFSLALQDQGLAASADKTREARR